MKSTSYAPASFHFKCPKHDGRIQILNEHSYVMGQYDQRLGTIIWERVLLATQKANLESYLLEHYPVPSSN